ncbi:metallophosphoesterase family protein [Tuwongella immobilis]|uniref:Phosphoesterase n=1 Tax=Tuwongella immobilis TaxID=692036 RepID=A0A6C2YQS5_9BACT|nr:metallophosphoesterase family protein [Tuwongella immobilis]VIP03509.1 Serine/threonine protein phosphatase OS=uncultured planctomycete GN=HGMM_F48A06C16 PE=4 SV=1: Metallophos_2 [Tuwongella immobilis]VTS04386.1 Serine/threonine protein phosphatase OS=uncultured planctomycete GN=HGMM_F48A06C16 PE=4 SV=1: Metallophos_2 [Tuwongella immobilis]
MRILLISDIHANWVALQSIREPFDCCVCLGDLVDYGPEPGRCIDWVERHAMITVRGNHDHAVAQGVQTCGMHGFRFLSGVTRYLSAERTTAEQRRYLGRLPTRIFRTIGGKRYLFVHATPRDPMDEYATPDPELWAKRLDGLDVDVVCVGHTHHPYCVQVGSKLVINPGSVGLPRDGDPRLSYAILDGDRVTLHRQEYDVDAVVRLVEESNLPLRAKQMLTEVYRNGKLAPQLAEPTVTSVVASSVLR